MQSNASAATGKRMIALRRVTMRFARWLQSQPIQETILGLRHANGNTEMQPEECVCNSRIEPAGSPVPGVKIRPYFLFRSPNPSTYGPDPAARLREISAYALGLSCFGSRRPASRGCACAGGWGWGSGEAVMPEPRVPGPVIKLHWPPRCGGGNQRLLYCLETHVAPWAKRIMWVVSLGKLPW